MNWTRPSGWCAGGLVAPNMPIRAFGLEEEDEEEEDEEDEADAEEEEDDEEDVEEELPYD